MDVDLVLAPVDGSDQSEEAMRYATAVADAYDAAVHVLFVLDESQVRAVEGGEVPAESVAVAQSEFVERVEAALGDRDCRIDRSTAAGFSPSRLRQSPGSVILDAAEEIDADLLVVPREPASDDPDEAIGRAALYVIQYASQPVLSV